MRVLLSAVSLALLAISAAFAQTPPATPSSAGAPPPPAKASRGGDITRDDYIERARKAAEKRFDRMDTNHDGVLTADERRAARASRRRSSDTAPPQ